MARLDERRLHVDRRHDVRSDRSRSTMARRGHRRVAGPHSRAGSADRFRFAERGHRAAGGQPDRRAAGRQACACVMGPPRVRHRRSERLSPPAWPRQRALHPDGLVGRLCASPSDVSCRRLQLVGGGEIRIFARRRPDLGALRLLSANHCARKDRRRDRRQHARQHDLGALQQRHPVLYARRRPKLEARQHSQRAARRRNRLGRRLLSQPPHRRGGPRDARRVLSLQRSGRTVPHEGRRRELVARP